MMFETWLAACTEPVHCKGNRGRFRAPGGGALLRREMATNLSREPRQAGRRKCFVGVGVPVPPAAGPRQAATYMARKVCTRTMCSSMQQEEEIGFVSV